MKVAIVLISALAFAHGGVRVVRQAGGWPAPTTPGWSTPAPSPGWASPSPGWGKLIHLKNKSIPFIFKMSTIYSYTNFPLFFNLLYFK